jgi:hypothetical protein
MANDEQKSIRGNEKVQFTSKAQLEEAKRVARAELQRIIDEEIKHDSGHHVLTRSATR